MRTCHLLMAAFSFAASVSLSAPTAMMSSASAWQEGTPQSNVAQPRMQQDYGQGQRIRLIAGTSRVIKFGFDVPDVIVGSPDVVDVQPVASDQIMVTGRRPGVSGLSVSDPNGKQHTLDILVVGDARQLQLTLSELFPRTTIRAFPLNTNVVLTGHVQKTAQIRQAEEVAQDFFPNGVRNLLTVGGPSKIALECKVVEVSRTKLRDMGIDWSLATSGFSIQNSASALLNGTTGAGNFFFQIVDGSDRFPLFLNLLKQNNLAKILTQPTVVTTPGRPASLLNGGLIPIPINTGLGVQSVEFREFGTKLDVLPILEGDGRIRVEVRAEVTDVAFDLSVNGTPGFRSRNVDTAVPLREGQTLALAGLIQNRTDSTSRGIPGLKDMPWIGSLFRRVDDTFNEVELIILITPRFISEIDPSMIGQLPGRQSVAPCDTDFYWRGYTEVPRTGNSYELGPVRGAAAAVPLYEQPAPGNQGSGSQEKVDADAQPLGSSQHRSIKSADGSADLPMLNEQASRGSIRPLQTNRFTFNDEQRRTPRTASRPARSPYGGQLPSYGSRNR